MSYDNDDFEKYKNKVLQFIRNPKQKSKGGQGDNFQFGNNSVWLIIAGLFLFLAAINSTYTVDADEEGVITRFGRYLKTSNPGLHMKLPWVDRVYKVQSRRRQEEVFGYRVNERTDRKQITTDESLMLSGDLNLANVEWMVQYEISDPWKFLFRVRDVPKTIRDISMSVMRRVVGDRLVGEVLTIGRAEISLEVQRLMQETLDEYDAGIRIVTVALQSVMPPSAVRPAFNDVNAARQEQESAINRAEREYNRVIPLARGVAAQTVADAQGYAINVVNNAKGDAQRFTSLIEEYRKSPRITRSRMYIETMEQVLSELDSFTVVDQKAKGLLPLYGPVSPAHAATSLELKNQVAQ